jgi:hypothetical protein
MRPGLRSKISLFLLWFGLQAGLASSVAVAADEASADTIADTRRWHEPYVTLLDVNFGEPGFQARWEYFHCGCGDILVRLEQSAPDGVLTGEILLVDGQALAARGMVSLSEDLEPMLQPPSIMMHLAFTLMEYGVPDGPASVTERRRIGVGSDSSDLKLNSGMATGTFKAPWKVTGETWPSGEGQRRFELRFEFSNPVPGDPDATTVFTFSGGQDYRRDDFPLAAQTLLEGWKLQWISKNETVASDPPEGLTLDDVRAQARALSQPEA